MRNYRFTHDHVRILRNMVERNLTIPHRFVCVTDQDIDDIETVRIDWQKHVPGTVFVRLMQRRPDYGEIIGGDRIFNLDIDVVITGNIDDIVSRTEPSVWWRNPNFGQPRRAFYQSSIQLFNAGHHSALWSDFDPIWTPQNMRFREPWKKPQSVNHRFGGAEQAWISERISWDEPFWDESHGIYGAGRLFNGEQDGGVQSELPDNARIVSVPGDRIPDQPEVMERHRWIKNHYY